MRRYRLLGLLIAGLTLLGAAACLPWRAGATHAAAALGSGAVWQVNEQEAIDRAARLAPEALPELSDAGFEVVPWHQVMPNGRTRPVWSVTGRSQSGVELHVDIEADGGRILLASVKRTPAGPLCRHTIGRAEAADTAWSWLCKLGMARMAPRWTAVVRASGRRSRGTVAWLVSWSAPGLGAQVMLRRDGDLTYAQVLATGLDPRVPCRTSACSQKMIGSRPSTGAAWPARHAL